MDYDIKAIPTTYKGIQFRSRLEAKWAAFFDQCDWRWQYEPVDFNGWIPDFLLSFPKERIYVEVKPIVNPSKAEFLRVAKTELGKWTPKEHRALIIGAMPFSCKQISENAEWSQADAFFAIQRMSAIGCFFQNLPEEDFLEEGTPGVQSSCHCGEDDGLNSGLNQVAYCIPDVTPAMIGRCTFCKSISIVELNLPSYDSPSGCVICGNSPAWDEEHTTGIHAESLSQK